MLELLTAPQNVPFAVALASMLVIAVVESAGLMLGGGVSEALDSMLPEIDDASSAAPATSAFSRFLGWL